MSATAAISCKSARSAVCWTLRRSLISGLPAHSFPSLSPVFSETYPISSEKHPRSQCTGTGMFDLLQDALPARFFRRTGRVTLDTATVWRMGRHSTRQNTAATLMGRQVAV